MDESSFTATGSSSTRRSRSSHRRSSSSRRPSLKRSSSGGGGVSAGTSANVSRRSSAVDMSGFDESTAEIPKMNISLDNTLPLDYFKQDMISVLQAMKISKWKNLNNNDPKQMDEIDVTRISGALTNSIYKISYKKFYPLLLRLYGAGSDSIIDRDTELKTLAKLSRKNIGPKLLGFFNNGRFEQFLNNSVTLTAKQIRDPKISRIIARRMKELHKGVNLENHERIAGPTCWQTIDKWFQVLRLQFKNLQMDQLQQLEILSIPFDKLEEMTVSYKKFLFQDYNKGLNFFNEMVFCHNDTQYGNLLFYNPLQEESLIDEIITTKTSSLSLENASSSNLALANNDSMKFDKKLVVIDFEYSGANIPAYDITNHFSEWMYDYTDPEKSSVSDTSKYPSTEERLNFIRSYYKYETGSGGRADASGSGSGSGSISSRRAGASPSAGSAATTTDVKIEKLYNECIKWRACNCLFWALWAIMKVVEKKSLLLQLKSKSSENEMIYAELGPNGEKYLIKEEKDFGEGIEEEEEATGVGNNFEIQNSVDDEFDYNKYAFEKLGIFISDLEKFGLIKDTSGVASGAAGGSDTTSAEGGTDTNKDSKKESKATTTTKVIEVDLTKVIKKQDLDIDFLYSSK